MKKFPPGSRGVINVVYYNGETAFGHAMNFERIGDKMVLFDTANFSKTTMTVMNGRYTITGPGVRILSDTIASYPDGHAMYVESCFRTDQWEPMDEIAKYVH